MSAIQRADRGSDWYVSFRYARRRIRRRSPVQSWKGAETYERVLRERFLALEERGIDPFHERTVTFAELSGRWMTAHVADDEPAFRQTLKGTCAARPPCSRTRE